MSKVFYYLTFAIGLIGEFAIMGWTDGYYLGVSGLLLVGGVVLEQFYSWRQSRPSHQAERNASKWRRRRQEDASLLTAVLTGMLHALCAWGYLAACHAALDRFPLRAAYYDRLLGELELRLQTLEEADAWKEAARLMEERLQGHLSPARRDAYEIRLVKYLVEAGQQAKTATERRALWDKAKTLADQFGVDGTAAEALLAQLTAEQASGVHGQDRVALLRKWKDSTATYQKKKRFEAADVLISEALTMVAAEQASAWRQSQLNNLITWAESAPVTQRVGLLTRAESFASKYGIAQTQVSELLAKAKQALRDAQPAPLPAGCRANVLQTLVRGAPVTILDVEVVDKQGESVEALRSKDFIVRVQGKPVECWIAKLQPALIKRPVLLVIDRSGSTRGAAAEAAEAGAMALFRALQPKFEVRVVLFATQVNVLPPIQDEATLRQALQKMPPDHGTALYAALMAGLALPGHQAGSRVIVFTDGQDTDSKTVTLTELIETARRQRANMDIVALQHDDGNHKLMRKLALETSGNFVPVANVASLQAAFSEVHQRLGRETYRLAIATTDVDAPLHLTIGGENSIELTIPTMVSATPPATKK